LVVDIYVTVMPKATINKHIIYIHTHTFHIIDLGKTHKIKPNSAHSLFQSTSHIIQSTAQN